MPVQEKLRKDANNGNNDNNNDNKGDKERMIHYYPERSLLT